MKGDVVWYRDWGTYYNVELLFGSEQDGQDEDQVHHQNSASQMFCSQVACRLNCPGIRYKSQIDLTFKVTLDYISYDRAKSVSKKKE